MLTDLAQRHRLDPNARSTYVNPVNGITKAVPNISGHRDWEASECPGSRLYDALPSIRTTVAHRLATPPSSTTTSPTATTSTTVAPTKSRK